MKQLNQIFQEATRQNASTTRHLTISEITDLPAVYIDPEWADKIGLTYPDPPPAKECEFCGKILKPVGWRALTRAEILK